MKLALSRRDFTLVAANMLALPAAFAQAPREVKLGTFGGIDAQNYIRAKAMGPQVFGTAAKADFLTVRAGSEVIAAMSGGSLDICNLGSSPLVVGYANGAPVSLVYVYKNIIDSEAVANGALLTMIMASRVTYGMAEQGLLPGVLARVLPKRRTPWVAIAATTVLAMALTLVGDLSVLASTVVLLLLFVFISTNVAVLVLRKDRVEHAHFRVPAAIPVLGVASCVLLLTRQEGVVWLYGLGLLAVGVVLYGLARLTGRRSAS